MKKKLLYAISTLTLTHTILLSNSHAMNLDTPIKDILAGQKNMINLSDYIITKSQLMQFYKSNQYASVWGDAQVGYLKLLIEKSYEDGLNPQDYNISLADSLTEVQRELYYTSLYMRVLSDLITGKTNPVNFESTARFKKKVISDYSQFISALKQPDADSFMLAIQAQAPKSPHYKKLKEALAYYRSEEVKAQFQHPVVASDTNAIRERLKVLGYEGSDLRSVLLKFQTDHSMDVSGAIGPKTTVALNMTAEQREFQIKMNLERLRWLSTNLGDKFIFVNLANQRMTVYDSTAIDSGGVALKMKVQVGQEFRKTPLMVTNVRQVILNPTWSAPDNVVVKDLVPKIKLDNGYLKSKHLKAYNNGVEVQQSAVDWAKVTFGSGIRIVQDSGPFNTLGLVKFMLTNGDSIFMHDTEHKEMFPNPKRLTSSGCMRLEKPIELAEYVLRSSQAWPMDRIQSMLATGVEGEVFQSEYPIDIKGNLPLYTMYLTTEIDESGKIIFLPDYYEQDVVLKDVLKKEDENKTQNNF